MSNKILNFFCVQIRLRNINWQDCKYRSFVVFIGKSQNIGCHNALGEYKLDGGRRGKH